MEKRLASVAVSANCQNGKPKRLCNSSPTQTESSLGSIEVIPRASCCRTAETVAAGEWPVIAPVSPRQRSTYRWSSTSKISAPRASRTKGGKAPAHLTIQFMGTPPSSDFRERSKRAADLGRSEMNFFCSDCIKEERRSRLIGGIHSPAAVAKK